MNHIKQIANTRFLLTALLLLAGCESGSEKSSRFADRDVIDDGLRGNGDGGAPSSADSDATQDPIEPSNPMPGPVCGDISCEVGSCAAEGSETRCSCPEGFGPATAGCPDTNECEKADACSGGTCRNTVGSFTCVCSEDEEWVDGDCLEKNECEDDPCAPGALCSDITEGYTCSCEDGQLGDGSFCKGAPDCTASTCGADGRCIETKHGYVCECAPGSAGRADCSLDCETLALDPALEAFVRSELEFPIEAGPLRPVHLAGWTDLDASDVDLASLDGLECWSHLESLSVRGSNLGAADESPLASLAMLPALRSLNLSCTQVTSLQALEDHPRLEELVYDNTAPGCIPSLDSGDGLARLPHLTRLILTGQRLTALPDFESRQLKEVQLSFNALTHLPDLTASTGLTRLSVAENELSHLNTIAEMKRLSHLDVSGNAITDLTPAASLTGLRELKASDNRIDSVSALGGLPGLSVLDLSLNEISDVSELASIPQLSSLYFAGNQVSNLGAFVEENYVGVLAFTENPIQCSEQEQTLGALIAQGVHLFGECLP